MNERHASSADSACTDSGSCRCKLKRPTHEETLLSVVLPVFNEAMVLPILLARLAQTLDRCGMQYELVFVDDGSTDDSPRVLEHMAATDRHVRVVHLSRNFGHQAAVQAGLAYAKGDAIVLMDSDMQDDPAAIVEFLCKWREGYDVVYALRTNRKESRLKRMLFAGFHRMLASVATVRIPADAGIFGLVDRRVAREIVALGESDRYFPGLRGWVGFRQIGVPVERKARYDEHPRVSMRGLFRLAKTAFFGFSTFPLLVFQLIGAAAAIVFVTLAAFAVGCKLFTTAAVPGWTSYMLTGSFFGALNALGICVLGEYVVRIYDQVRGRPLFIVDRTVNLDCSTGQAGKWTYPGIGGTQRFTADTANSRWETGTAEAAEEQTFDAPYWALVDQVQEISVATRMAAAHPEGALPAAEEDELCGRAEM